MRVYFDPIAIIIKQALSYARSDIRIAVCWFTHSEILKVVSAQCRRGVSVTLIINYDQLNLAPSIWAHHHFFERKAFQSIIRSAAAAPCEKAICLIWCLRIRPGDIEYCVTSPNSKSLQRG